MPLIDSRITGPQLLPLPQTQALIGPQTQTQTQTMAATNQQTRTSIRTKDENAPCTWRYSNIHAPYVPRSVNLSRYIESSFPNAGIWRMFADGDNEYLYVVTLDSRFIVANQREFRDDYPGERRLHHPDLVFGADVAYAGEIWFESDAKQVERWNRGSGHYLPNPDGDAAESECIRQIIKNAWALDYIPAESPF